MFSVLSLFFLQRFEIINPVRCSFSVRGNCHLEGGGMGRFMLGRREGSYGQMGAERAMVKRRRRRGNSKGRRITCKHVSTFDRGISNDVWGGACCCSVGPKDII